MIFLNQQKNKKMDEKFIGKQVSSFLNCKDNKDPNERKKCKIPPLPPPRPNINSPKPLPPPRTRPPVSPPPLPPSPNIHSSIFPKFQGIAFKKYNKMIKSKNFVDR